MLPKLIFSEVSGTVNGYVNFPRDLYHLLARGTTPWLLHCYSFRDRGGEFQQASKWSVGFLCSVSLGAGNAGWRTWDAALLFCEKTCQAKSHQIFLNEKGNGELKWAPHTSVVFVQ